MRTNPHCRPAKRGSGAAGTGGGCAPTSTLTRSRSAPGTPSPSAAPSSASPATLRTRVAMSAACLSTDRAEEQLLRALEARRDLERGQRFLLRCGAVAGQQVALAQIAVRGCLVGSAGLERRAELARGDRRVALAERHAAPAGMRGGVEGIERHDARE